MSRRSDRCRDCGVDASLVTGIGHYYMAHDEVWQQATQGNARVRFLCLGCLETRLSRPLRATDFRLTPSEMAERLVIGGEHNVLPEPERQRWLDYWRAVPCQVAMKQLAIARPELKQAAEARQGAERIADLEKQLAAAQQRVVELDAHLVSLLEKVAPDPEVQRLRQANKTLQRTKTGGTAKKR